MKKSMWLVAVTICLAISAGIWRAFEPVGESLLQVRETGPEEAVIERALQRTLRESRTGNEEPVIISAPSGHFSPPASALSRTITHQPAPNADSLPEGYTLGTYHGAMQRAPRTGVAVSELAPNPDWLESDASPDAIIDQAAQAGRPFTFGVLRVAPGTDLQALNRSLVALDSRIEGSTGDYVRVRLTSERNRLESIAALSGVLGMGPVPPGIKADEVFVQELLSRPAGEPVPVYITLMAPDPAGDWRRALTELDVVVGAYDRDLRSYTANMPAMALAPVLASDFVLSVEPIPIVTANHASAVPVMGVDGLRRYDPVTERFSGLAGSGVSVGVLDTGLNTSHTDIAYGRSSICGASFVGGEDWDLWLDLRGHGTHVFGTIAGAGRSHSSLAGMAPAVSHLRFAKVLSYYGSGIAEDVRRGMDHLSHPTHCIWQGELSDAVKPLIVNMSLGAVALQYSGRGVGERKLDAVVFGHSQLYVVAQANSGTQGFSNFGTAKNSLAVGAVHDSGIIAEFSSHGPTADGRLAPNVVGTGVNLTSVRGGAARYGHKTLTGTSMASPSVAGVAALLMEARPEFRNQPALARARLMASAIRPTVHLENRARLPGDNTDGPGTFQTRYGLGLVSARTSLASRDDPAGWLIGSASARPDNDSYEYIDIEVPDDAGRLDIVLTWDEQPADTLTRSVLNNLDLWADQAADCAEDACGEHASRSEVDNVEWLLIEDPVPGTYRIKVVPVEIYGESSTAAVAWKILRGEPTAQLEVSLEDTSAGTDSEYITLDVSVDASNYLASGTTVQLSCRSQRNHCWNLHRAYLPDRTRVYRHDATSGTENDVYYRDLYEKRGTYLLPPIPVGEVVAGEPRRLQLWFRRQALYEEMEAVACITASSWNARAAGQCMGFGTDNPEDGSLGDAPVNDNFTASKRILGVTGEAPADLLLASREPGEPGVIAESRTLWYSWQAPADGLFRFRLQETESGNPENANFVLFTGGSLANLDRVIEKNDGAEFTFAARADTVYRLRLGFDKWRVPLPLTLSWESADSRPANDDFAFAQLIEGVFGQIESTNNGATVESTEFHGGLAATVWYEWTAPEDGLWYFGAQHHDLVVYVFEGSRVDDLRLLSYPGHKSGAYLAARGGHTYRVAVGVKSADASPYDFRLNWRRATADEFPGTNHLFESATELGGPEGRESLDHGGWNEGFVVEPGEPASTGAGTRWWQWTAPADGRYTWSMDQSKTDGLYRTSTAFRLTIFSGDALENLELMGSLRSGGAALVLDATGGTRYWIAIGRSPDSTGHLRLSWPIKRPEEFTWGPTPANDDRTTATPIAGLAGSDDAVLGYATKASNEPSDLVGAGSVWWRWRAPTSGWQRFWVEGHPLSAVIGMYPDTFSRLAIADSERTFLANGRVEVHLLTTAGQSYDIRVASRPGLNLGLTGIREALAATLRWEAADAPAFLAYKGAATPDPLATDPDLRGFNTPRSLAMSDDGHYLFSSSANGIFAFLRDTESGDLALAYRTPATVEMSGHFENLWWNSRDDRLIVTDEKVTYSFALPEEGIWLSPSTVTLQGGDSAFFRTSVISPDGRHIYGQDYRYQTIALQGYSVDSPTQWTHMQRVAAHGPTDGNGLILPGIGRVIDMTFSPGGGYLYAATENALLVFSRDLSSGRLELTRQIQRSDGLDNDFSLMGNIKNLSLDGTHTMLFVSGSNISDNGFVQHGGEVTIAAFAISSNPSDPAHRGTLSRLAWQNDGDIYFNVHSHVPRPGPFIGCDRLMPHAGRVAVDVICADGFFVVEWNPANNVLEVTDAADTGAEDRFGNTLPYERSYDFLDTFRQVAQSPDGAHFYVATDVASGTWGYADAIHVFERASAMTPAERGADAGETISYPAEVAEPNDPSEPGNGMDGPPQTGMEGE